MSLKAAPDALDFLSVPARLPSLPVSLQLLAQEDAPPLSVEMRTVTEEGSACSSIARSKSGQAHAVDQRAHLRRGCQLQSRTGGRLGEVLGGLAESMREAESVVGEVKALAAHGRVTGAVLTVLPVLIALMMTFVNPGYLNIIFENQTGRLITIVCVIALVTAHFVIRKIVDIRL
jgi:tight adherence protein B